MIFKFAPILRPMIWGFELWVMSGYPERISTVSEGPCEGMTINELVAAEKEALVGRKVYEQFGDEFPLLIKFIGAKQNLSIQVHPDEALAQKRHNGHGKTEMWYVINTEPGAHLYSGLSVQIDSAEYERRIADDSIVEVLADHKIAPGDVFFLPAGRIHAICGGTYLAEIQQTSDLTYRIYDYGRPGADGKPRQLHTELAKDAIDYRVYEDYRTVYTPCPDKEVELVRCPYFTTSLYDLDKPLSQDLSDLDSFLVVMCLEGEGCVDGVAIRADECLLVSASQSSVTFTPSEGAKLKLLTSHL